MSARKYLAYTYLIGWSKSDQWYYGVRWTQNRKQEFDIWIDYFTNSTPVKHMRAFVGEPDVVHIDKIFENEKDAMSYEIKVLKEHNITNSIHWLNKGVISSYIPTEETRQKMSVANSNPSKETRQKMKDAKEGMYFGKDNPNYENNWTHEQKNILSQKIKKQFKNGRINAMKGKKRPDLTERNKLPKRWITNGRVNKLVPIENLQKYLDDDFYIGRTVNK